MEIRMMRHLSAYLLICAVLSVHTAGTCNLDGLSSSAIYALHPRSIDAAFALRDVERSLGRDQQPQATVDDAPSRNSSF